MNVNPNFRILLLFIFCIVANSYAQRGKNLNYTAAGTVVVNTYTTLANSSVSGATAIRVASNALTGGVFGATPLQPGDLVLIIQMQGATINCETYTSNAGGAGAFGPYTVPLPYTFAGTWPDHLHEWGALNWFGYFNEPYNGYNNSGRFEQAEVWKVGSTDSIYFQCGLTNNYDVSGHVQIVRVPRFNDLTIPAGTNIIPNLWNGSTGGLVAIEVAGNLSLNGSVNANAAGFRGGVVDAFGLPGSTTDPTEKRFAGSHDPSQGSEKGEGIHGFYTELDAIYSRYGVSAASNGGGGGGFQNCGGGGGSNIYTGALRYTGTGVPNAAFNAFWSLDNAYPNFNTDPQTYSSLNGNISPGGGRGGYAYSNSNQNELVVGPRNASWGGDARKSNGGLGGHALTYDPTRLFAGGGGGAGDQDSGEGGNGGRGGGIVFLTVYGTTSGSGNVSSNGAAGQNTNPTNAAPNGGDPRKGNDGAGGGGAGGYLYIKNANALPASLSLNAVGGAGGNQNLTYLFPTTDEASGPGGGGSGGAIARTSGAAVSNVTGGAGGTTNSSHVNQFTLNGATGGHAGVANLPTTIYNLTASNATICAGQTANLSVTVTGTLPTGGTVQWYNQQFGGSVLQTGTTYNVSPGSTTTYYVGVCSGGTFRIPVTVTVNSAPNLVITDPAPICGSSSADLTLPAVTAGSDAGPLTYWTNAGATTPLATPNSVGSGTYYIQLDLGGGCTTVEAVNVTVNPNPVLNITNPAAVCAPSTVNLTAGAVTAGSDAGTLTYWSDAGATMALGTPNAVGNGTYYIQLQNAAGCTTIQSVTATVNSTPNLIITNPPAACSPATVDLTASAVTSGSDAGTLTYWTDAGATSALASPNAVASSGTYYIQLQNASGCTSIQSVNVTVTSSPNLSITDPAAVCNPSTVDLTQAAVTAGSDAGTLTYWTDAGATVSLGTPNAVGTGVYYIQLDIGGGCVTVEAVNVLVNATPNLSITDPTAVCSPSTVDLTQASVTAGSDAGTLSYWTDAGATSSLGTPTAVGNGTYYIQLVDANSCSSIQAVNATVNGQPNLVISNPPTACSPATVDITAASVTAGSDPGTLTYWTDAGATSALASPNAVATSGTYYIQLQNALGCTSIQSVVVNITSTPNLNVTDPGAVCAPGTIDITQAAVTAGSDAGTLSYWTDAGATISLGTPNSVGNGTYYIQLDIGGGCTTVEPVNVTVNSQPNLTITDPAGVCSPSTVDLTPAAVTAGSDAGTLTYWTDAGATVSLGTPTSVGNGTYYIQLEDANTCTSIAAVNATVYALPNLVITDPNAVCSPSSVDLTQAAVTAGSDAGTLTYWSDAGATIGLGTPNSVGTGTYYIQLQDANSCSVVQAVNATVNAQPNLVISDPAAQCAPASVDITQAAVTAGSDAGTLSYWSDAGATVSLATPSAVGSGTYFIQLIDANGCNSIEAVNATVNPQPSLVITDPNAECVPNTVDLTQASVTAGSDAGTLSYWTDAGATSALASPNSVATSGTYYIQLIDANGCSSIGPVDATVTTSPNLVITDPNGVCAPGTVDITQASVTAGSDPGTLTYWQDAGATVPLATPNSVSTGTYYIQLELSAGCSSVEAVNATVNAQPNLIVSDPAALCAPAMVNLTAAGVTAGSDPGTLSYWTDAAATNTLSTPGAVNTGTYFIQLTDANSCSNIAAVNATVNPQDNANFMISPQCEGGQATVTGLTGGSFSIVSPLNGASIDPSTGTLTNAEPGLSYEISYTTSGACPNSSSEFVVPQDCSTLPEIVIPTAFTPDGDLVNDTWIIQDIDVRYPNAVISVYNRWGNLIYEHNSIEDGAYAASPWDGTNQSNGQKMPVASYYYLIETGVDGEGELKGIVSILLEK